MMHASIASTLRFCLPEGAFKALDGFMAAIERVWHGKEGCKQRKKKLRRKAARKVSRTLRLLSCFVSWTQTGSLVVVVLSTRASPVLKSWYRHYTDRKVVMLVQAVQCDKPGEAALHTQANDHHASVSTGAAAKGELLGSSNKSAFGGPAVPVTGTRHGHKQGARPLQSSADAAQVWATVC